MCFSSLSAFNIGLTLSLNFKIMPNKLLCYLLASFIVILPYKNTSTKRSYCSNFNKFIHVFTWLIYQIIFINLFFQCLISFNLFSISSFSKFLRKTPLIYSGFLWCFTGFKPFKASTCFYLGLQLFFQSFY